MLKIQTFMSQAQELEKAGFTGPADTNFVQILPQICPVFSKMLTSILQCLGIIENNMEIFWKYHVNDLNIYQVKLAKWKKKKKDIGAICNLRSLSAV